MIVLSLTNCPPSLRGDLTKWLLEIDVGVYVGRITTRVREELWARIRDNIQKGQAIMVYSTNTEQGFDFKVHNALWQPMDFDGLKLMLRPNSTQVQSKNDLRDGFSKAAKMRKTKQMKGTKSTDDPLPTTYVVLDVETTGLMPYEDEIIEMAAIKVESGVVVDQVQFLIKPTQNLRAEVIRLTGLTDEILELGVSLSVAVPQLLAFVNGLSVVSHNIQFDFDFLQAACNKLGLPRLSNKGVDTLKLSRKLVRNVGNYKLSTLVDHFEIEEQANHRSLNDCWATHHLYNKLNEIAARGN